MCSEANFNIRGFKIRRSQFLRSIKSKTGGRSSSYTVLHTDGQTQFCVFSAFLQKTQSWEETRFECDTVITILPCRLLPKCWIRKIQDIRIISQSPEFPAKKEQRALQV